MGAGHSAEGEGGAYASDPPAHDRRKHNGKRRRHSVDSVASYSSQNHVDRIRTQNFSAASCQDEGDFGSIKTSLFRRSSSNLEYPYKRPESVTSNTSSTRSRLRELVERKSQDEHKPAASPVEDIQYFENPSETLEFDRSRNSLDSRKSQEEHPKKRKISKSKDKDKESCESKNKKHEKYQSKLADYYKLPVQLPQDEFYQHLTRSKAAEELLQKKFSNSFTEFNSSYGRLCKHKEADGPNLRRSRSLAVIREETFTDLQIQNHSKSKRSQLIPRARLFDKPCFKDRLTGRAKYQTKEEVLENIYIDSTASCFGDISAQRVNNTGEINDRKNDKEDTLSQNGSHHTRSISGSWPNLNDEVKPTNLSEDSIGRSRNPSEVDSLDSNYVRKHYNFEAHLKNCKGESPDTERSLTTPDHSKQPFIASDRDSDNEEERSKNNTPKSFTNDSLSVSHSERDKKESTDPGTADDGNYDEVSLNRKDILEGKSLCEDTEYQKDSDRNSVVSENDGTVSSPPDSITSYISISIASSDKSHKLEYLANSLAEKIDEYCESQFRDNTSVKHNAAKSETKESEEDPVYTKVNKKRSFADTRQDSFLSKTSSGWTETHSKNNSDVYVSNTFIENDNVSIKSNCASTKNITTEPFVTTLIENQYYSLPDINISKCLRKSERIDRQLREEDPEDIPCENTYEIAHSHFREILSAKPNQNYGQLNKISPQQNNNHIYKSEPHIIQNFTKLEDDLKSIITIESSNADDKEANYYQSPHQNERELNEIEGTIRNNKIITKSESLRLASDCAYRQGIHIPKSLSQSNISKSVQEKKVRTGIKKHYSLRQRDPTDEDILRLPSPNTVHRTLTKPVSVSTEKYQKHIQSKHNSILSRVQSFKSNGESNVTIVPLSGHQTIVINPPVTQSLTEIKPQPTVKQAPPAKPLVGQTKSNQEACVTDKKKSNLVNTSAANSINTSTYCKPKDPFINIKVNKVVKTTIPKFKKETNESIASVQFKFEKASSKLIIKDNKTAVTSTNNSTTKENMTRPQILQVVDSKDTKQATMAHSENSNKALTVKTKPHHASDTNIEIKVLKTENVKEKLNDAIKTDMEYQEKLHSVKNYWSKLADKIAEHRENLRETNSRTKQESDITEDTHPATETEKCNDKDEDNENSSLPDISVGNIIKSLESVKIVDSIRKISQTKLNLWKDETEKVKSDSEIEETTVKKIVKDCEGNVYEKPKKPEVEVCRETPEIEIVELSNNDNANEKTQATLIKAKGYEKGCEDFDHVRYKVMKSELFKNSMIANYRKEAQFDGLLQYLQDYSFQELLVNNNIVIIEPVRTKIEPPTKNSTDTCKISPSLFKKSDNCIKQIDKTKNAIRRHFFYHPIRVNKEIIEEELPNPDTVKKVRNLFEDTLKMKSPMTQDPPLIDDAVVLTRRATSYRNLSEETKSNKNGGRKKVMRPLTIDTTFGQKKWDNVSLSSGVSSGDLSSNNEYENENLSPYAHKNLKDNVYSSSDEYLCDSLSHDFCCESQYVSPDILKKIRECGTTITYYGGKVMNSKPGSTVSPMTKAIMEEIKGLQKNCSRDCYSCQIKCKGDKCSCLVDDKHKQIIPEKQTSTTSSDSGNHDHSSKKSSESFPAFKFKLVKSNSCSSRLELTGTDDTKNLRMKYRKLQPHIQDPPLVLDEENSVKNKICRLESYNKGMAKTPFENKDNEDNDAAEKPRTSPIHFKKNNFDNKTQKNNLTPQDKNEDKIENNKTDNQIQAEKESFENKFYYVNDKLDRSKSSTGKFGEMVFEEFEVLESYGDSLNSNKSQK